MTLNAKIGGFTDFFRDIGLRKSISFTRSATVANATRAYGRCVLWSRWAESKWYAIFETITTELEMLQAFARLVSFAQISCSVDGKPMQFVTEFKYLGHVITCSLSDDKDLQRE